MATQSSTLAWEIPGTEECVGYSPWWSQRVGHDLSTKIFLKIHNIPALKLIFLINLEAISDSAFIPFCSQRCYYFILHNFKFPCFKNNSFSVTVEVTSLLRRGCFPAIPLFFGKVGLSPWASFWCRSLCTWSAMVFSEFLPGISHFLNLSSFIISYESLTSSFGFSSLKFLSEACEWL